MDVPWRERAVPFGVCMPRVVQIRIRSVLYLVLLYLRTCSVRTVVIGFVAICEAHAPAKTHASWDRPPSRLLGDPRLPSRLTSQALTCLQCDWPPPMQPHEMPPPISSNMETTCAIFAEEQRFRTGNGAASSPRAAGSALLITGDQPTIAARDALELPSTETSSFSCLKPGLEVIRSRYGEVLHTEPISSRWLPTQAARRTWSLFNAIT